MKAFYLDNIDVATLMKALDECKGNVILLTDEGDRFNLKSKLSQITGIMKLIDLVFPSLLFSSISLH